MPVGTVGRTHSCSTPSSTALTGGMASVGRWIRLRPQAANGCMSTTSRTCPSSMRRRAASSVRARVSVDSVLHSGQASSCDWLVEQRDLLLSVDSALHSGQASSCDSLVEQRDLVSVHPGGWDPFRQSVGVHPTGPAPASEIVVVITTQQCQIVEIRLAAVDPLDDVVTLTPLGRMITTRK